MVVEFVLVAESMLLDRALVFGVMRLGGQGW